MRLSRVLFVVASMLPSAVLFECGQTPITASDASDVAVENTVDVGVQDVGVQDAQVVETTPCDAGMLLCKGSCVDPTSATNCGACGHDCLGGSCAVLDGGTKPMCQPIVLTTSVTSSAWDIATDGTYVVYSDDTSGGGVYNISVNGTNQTPFKIATGDARPITIVNGNVYWMQYASANAVLKGKAGTSGATDLNLGSAAALGGGGSVPLIVPFGIAVDSAETYVGFLEAEVGPTQNEHFGSCSLGGTPSCSYSSNDAHGVPGKMITDDTSLFWAEGFKVDAGGTIEQTALAFGTVTDIITNFPNPGPLTLAGPGFFAWYNGGSGSIFRSPISSPTPEPLTFGTYASAIAADATYVYLSGQTTIQYVDQSGSGTPQVLVDGISPGVMTRDSKALYWYNGDGSIQKVALPI